MTIIYYNAVKRKALYYRASRRDCVLLTKDDAPITICQKSHRDTTRRRDMTNQQSLYGIISICRSQNCNQSSTPDLKRAFTKADNQSQP